MLLYKWCLYKCKILRPRGGRCWEKNSGSHGSQSCAIPLAMWLQRRDGEYHNCLHISMRNQLFKIFHSSFWIIFNPLNFSEKLTFQSGSREERGAKCHNYLSIMSSPTSLSNSKFILKPPWPKGALLPSRRTANRFYSNTKALTFLMVCVVPARDDRNYGAWKACNSYAWIPRFPNYFCNSTMHRTVGDFSFPG